MFNYKYTFPSFTTGGSNYDSKHEYPCNRTHSQKHSSFLGSVTSLRSRKSNVSNASKYGTTQIGNAVRALAKPMEHIALAIMAGFACTISVGQAIYLRTTYVSPPDAKGPRYGVSFPVFDNRAGSYMSRSRENRENISRAKHILFIGDSLVTGVGGDSSAPDGPRDGPALPRATAEGLANELNEPVRWSILGLKGAHISAMKEKLLPELKNMYDRGILGQVSAVVLVTGVNDMKRLASKYTHNDFRTDLTDFIMSLRTTLKDAECPVCVPAMSGVSDSPGLHRPLRSVMTALNDLFNGQKAIVARCVPNVTFIPRADLSGLGLSQEELFSSQDWIHPSELGYRKWGTYIGEEMARSFRQS